EKRAGGAVGAGGGDVNVGPAQESRNLRGSQVSEKLDAVRETELRRDPLRLLERRPRAGESAPIGKSLPPEEREGADDRVIVIERIVLAGADDSGGSGFARPGAGMELARVGAERDDGDLGRGNSERGEAFREFRT